MADAQKDSFDALNRERQRVLDLRQAFRRGTRWQHKYVEDEREKDPNTLNAWNRDAMVVASSAEYPMPQMTRPLRVTLNDGSVFSYAAGADEPMVRHDRCGGSYVLSGVAYHFATIEDFMKLSRILSGETELVDAES